jgi:hypothetical protein
MSSEQLENTEDQIKATAENDCYFVSSRGLLKSCHIRSPNPHSSCNSDEEYLFALVKNPSTQFNNMRIYVCSELLPYFVKTILQHINVDFVLLTGDSDLNIPIDVLDSEGLSRLLSNSYLRRWGAQNLMHVSNPKQLQLPIGLDYHTYVINPASEWRLPNESTLPIQQEKLLQELRCSSLPLNQRIPKIYTNAHHRLDKFNDRSKAIQAIQEASNNLLILEPYIIPRTKVWENYTKHAFILSPFGNGFDCHRTWEALCCGCIVIMRNSFMAPLFEGLPVLNVREWSDINEELLQKTLEEYSTKTWNYEKLTLQYWLDELHKY